MWAAIARKGAPAENSSVTEQAPAQTKPPAAKLAEPQREKQHNQKPKQNKREKAKMIEKAPPVRKSENVTNFEQTKSTQRSAGSLPANSVWGQKSIAKSECENETQQSSAGHSPEILSQQATDQKTSQIISAAAAKAKATGDIAMSKRLEAAAQAAQGKQQDNAPTTREKSNSVLRVDAPVFVPGNSPSMGPISGTSFSGSATPPPPKQPVPAPFIPGSASAPLHPSASPHPSSVQASQLAALLPPAAATAPTTHIASVQPKPAPPKPAPKSWAALAARNVPVETLETTVSSQPSLAANQTATTLPGVSAQRNPRGLLNRRNECFLNATLQALVACTPLVDAIARSESPSITSVLHAMQTFLQQYTAKPELGDVRSAILPESILALLPVWRPQQGAQEDAQELLSWVLDRLHEETTISDTAGKNTKKQEAAEVDEWMEVGKKNKAAMVSSTVQLNMSAISNVVGGSLRSVVKRSGRGESVSRQPFLSLPLDIADSGVRSLEDAIDRFVRRESLDHDTVAHKSVALENMPQVLVLHLSRFINKGSSIEKISKQIHFGEKLTLDRRHMAPSVTSGGVPEYHLVAVIAHHGKKAQSGHYTCDVWVPQEEGAPQGGWWARCDDDKVTRVRSDEVLSQPAYVLVYQQAK